MRVAGSAKAFGVTTANVSFFVNNKMPLGDSGYGSMCNEAVLNSGDVFKRILL